MDDECSTTGATSPAHGGSEVTAVAHAVGGGEHPYDRGAAIRRTARRDPCADGPPEWRGRPGCSYAAESHASWRDAGCWAGRSACSREDSRFVMQISGQPISERSRSAFDTDLHRTPALVRGHAKRGRCQALPRYGGPPDVVKRPGCPRPVRHRRRPGPTPRPVRYRTGIGRLPDLRIRRSGPDGHARSSPKERRNKLWSSPASPWRNSDTPGVRERTGSGTSRMTRPAIELVRRSSVRMVGLDEDPG